MQDLMNQARGELRHEPIERRVRATAGGETVVDSRRALLMWEPRRICPVYAVPAEDIRADLSPAPETGDEAAGVLHPGVPFSVHTTAGEPLTVGDRVGAGFRFADADLDGYVELDFRAFDEWYEEEERIFAHPRDPFHRIDILPSSRSVRIEVDGDVIAETTRAHLLFETSVYTRFYIPREDVRPELEPSERISYCPYKGQASYWSLEAGGRRRQDIAWSYEDPRPEVSTVTGFLAFWDERVDVYVDGELRARPGGAIAAAFKEEFALR
jgi:uncharacterized protein (DUF427 family)